MATKKKKARRRKKALMVVKQEGACADNPKLKLWVARVGGGYDVGPVTAPTKTKGKAKLVALIRKELR